MAVFQRPGSHALAAAEAVEAEMSASSKNFPKGLEYRVIYNPTEFIAQSIDAVMDTLLEAVVLVVIVILVFLQNWRAARSAENTSDLQSLMRISMAVFGL